MTNDRSDDSFEAQRPLLFAIAYRMLGSAMDAEDMVQETFLRWQGAPTGIDSPKAYLTTIITRLCINQLQSARARRESYVGAWLPEPVTTGGDGASLLDPSSSLQARDSISLAFLVLLEQLSPAERAVFLLREVFDYDYGEIAAIVGKSEEACRQLFTRARKHVSDNRPRFHPAPDEHGRLVQSFLSAVQSGEVEQLAQLLAEDVVIWADGAGQRGAVLRPVSGRDPAARFIFGVRRFAPEVFTFEIAPINGKPAIILRDSAGAAFNCITFEVGDGLIRAFYIVGNPDKLKHI